MWYGVKLFLRRKYGPTYVPKSLVAGATVAVALGVGGRRPARTFRRLLRSHPARLPGCGRKMAESSSPALPGDVEWLPGPGGGRVLRIHPPRR